MAPDSMIVVVHGAGGGPDPNLPIWSALAGAGVGLLASLIGAITAFKIAKRQLTVQATASENSLRATVLAANRVRWIETLRNEVAGFAAMAAAIVTDLQLPDAESVDFPAKVDKLMLHSQTISLLTNHEEQDSRDLEAAIEDLEVAINHATENAEARHDPIPFEEKLATIRTIARRIQKAEWEKVKRLE